MNEKKEGLTALLLLHPSSLRSSCFSDSSSREQPYDCDEDCRADD